MPCQKILMSSASYNSDIKAIVDRLPSSPGCYQYLDKTGKIIYVGKAKNLKRRVSSYFRTDPGSYKTKVLVSQICDIKYAVVKTDQEAFLLENSLIKQHNPKYNVLLKDGKTYPYICVTKEEFPRIFKTRRVNRRTGYYYGPFSHLGSMYAMLDVIKKLYKPRTCNMPMTVEGVNCDRYRSCLEWHIKRCDAPCIRKQSHEEYMRNIEDAKEILKGNTRALLTKMYGDMQRLSEELRFEEAEEMKQRYLLIQDYCSKSEVVSSTIDDVDVFSVTSDDSMAFINFLHVAGGSINQAFTFEYKKKLDEDDRELLQMAVIEIRNRQNSTTKEIIVPFDMEMELDGVTFTVPQRGDKKTLLELSLMNGKQYRFDRLKQAEKLNPEQKAVRMMKEIQTALHLPKLPYRIECFDNSNISGTDAVAGLVVFKKLKPSKQDYRKFNIKTVVGSDDYASMREVVWRRYSRQKEEGAELPDVIITDGGKGQMGIVSDVLRELELDIPVVGLAKSDRHRTNEVLIYDAEDSMNIVSVGMKTDSEVFHLFTRIQDEVHRYAISFHRDKRIKGQTHSELDDIKGIGVKTKQALLQHFRSVKQIREADMEALENVVGKAKARVVYDFLKKP